MNGLRTNNPTNYQEEVKTKSFKDFLTHHGILSDEISSTQGSTVDDSEEVKDRLHYGVKLLTSNSGATNRKHVRAKFEVYLVKQAALYMANMLPDVEALQNQISDFLLEDQKKNSAGIASAENLEMEEPLIPVTPSHSEVLVIRAGVIPLHVSTPEARPTMSVQRPQKITPFAKGDSNVVNVRETAGTSDDCLPKKVAQLERALTYACYRAGKEDIEEVVGYETLCMSMIDGTSLASIIISLHPDIFPLLARMQKKGGLAYLLSSRSVFDDVQRALECYSELEERFRSLENNMVRLQENLSNAREFKDDMSRALESFQTGVKWTVLLSCLSIGIALVAWRT